MRADTGSKGRVDDGSTRAPIRTCIGCRQRGLAAELLRVVVRRHPNGNAVVIADPVHRLPGRGAWLHPVSSCLNTAVRRRAFGRALRVSGNLDISPLEQYLENRHEHS